MDNEKVLFEDTVTFSAVSGDESANRILLRRIYDAMTEKGYNPINQLAGYILSGDPTYITNYKGARGITARIDREELLSEMIRDYLGIK